MTSERDENDSVTTQLHTDSQIINFPQLERRPVLVSIRGELLATPIPLERDSVTIGRALDADIRLNDSRASRLHAQIVADKTDGSNCARFRVIDLGSTNGTLVNGQVIREAVLNDGDKILVGDHLFRFEMLDEIDQEFQQQIHRLIGHDELTGLLTSKSFFTELRREAARAEEEGILDREPRRGGEPEPGRGFAFARPRGRGRTAARSGRLGKRFVLPDAGRRASAALQILSGGSEKRGHPRLRCRALFAHGKRQRDFRFARAL